MFIPPLQQAFAYTMKILPAWQKGVSYPPVGGCFTALMPFLRGRKASEMISILNSNSFDFLSPIVNFFIIPLGSIIAMQDDGSKDPYTE